MKIAKEKTKEVEDGTVKPNIRVLVLGFQKKNENMTKKIIIKQITGKGL